MGIFNAMQTAVSGMKAQAYALENISGNIANSQTIGFKRVGTNFQDMVPDLGPSTQLSGGVMATSQGTNSLAGAFRTTGVDSNIALSGDGYFAVSKKTVNAAGESHFATSPFFTRRGDFVLDKNYNLVNGAGYYLMGFPVDPKTGIANSGTPTTIQLPTGDVPPKETANVTYQGNVPKTPSVTGPALAPATATTTISADGEASFLTSTFAGGTVTVYDSSGTPVSLQTRWAKNSDGTYDLYYESDSAATGTASKWTFMKNFTFDSSGTMTAPSPPTITETNFKIDKSTLSSVTFDFTGMTRYSDNSGQFRATNLSQDGYSSGSLNSVYFGENGRIYAKYSNGMQVAVADIAVAHFKGEDGLKQDDSGIYEQTDQSGEPIYGLNGSNIVVGGVEGSNTDIAQEFTLMIATQQAYSANAKVIMTAQEMMTEVVNVIR